VAFTKTAWEQAGGYPEWLYTAEDTLFNIRLRQIGCEFAFCRDAIVRWRPRETWGALAKQRINFSRGNARIGVSTPGYLINLRSHGVMLALILASPWYHFLLLVALGLFGWHIHKRLWSQAVAVTPDNALGMRLRVLAVMEFVRVVNLYGFLRGRFDRLSDPSYIDNIQRYMGVASVDELDFLHTRPQYRVKNLSLPLDRETISLIALALCTTGCGVVAWLARRHARLDGAPGNRSRRSGCLRIVGKIARQLLANRTEHSRRHPGALPTVYGVGNGAPRFLGLRAAAIHRQRWCTRLLCNDRKLRLGLVRTIRGAGRDPGYHRRQFAPVHAEVALQPGTVGWVDAISDEPVIPALGGCHTEPYSSRRRRARDRFGAPVCQRVWQLATQGRAAEVVALASSLVFYCGSSPAPHGCRRHALKWAPRERTGTARPTSCLSGPTRCAPIAWGAGYRRALTPNIDALGAQGALLGTATSRAREPRRACVDADGNWPRTNGVRDNFVSDTEARLRVAALPHLLKPLGYRSAALSDWCGADMGKFGFGFDYTDLPEDQWNLKYLIRQGPKDLRLFISLFTHNRLGRLLLPELHYLGGVPLTTQIGRRSRRLLARLAAGAQPFLLNVFYSTTHPPFASEWPWYTRFTDSAYAGESKFAMARLTDPFAIIRRQGAPKEEFDLDQIIDLYDGCVAHFDDQVGRTLRHLEACGIADNTIVVVYSDHGMEFFEHDTWGQGNSAVGDFSSRIPLVIRDPRNLLVARSTRSCAASIWPHAARTGRLRSCGLHGRRLLGRASAIPRAAPNSMPTTRPASGSPTSRASTSHLRYPNLLDLITVPDGDSGRWRSKSSIETLCWTQRTE
jgi:hypothetical protein